MGVEDEVEGARLRGMWVGHSRVTALGLTFEVRHRHTSSRGAGETPVVEEAEFKGLDLFQCYEAS